MIPVLGGEVEEGEQRFQVLREAGNGLIILGVVFVSEHIDRYLGRRAGWRAVDLAKVDLHVDLDREGDLVQYAGHSLLDLAATVLTYAAVRVSGKPADAEHQYGHGKIDAPAGVSEKVTAIARRVPGIV